MRLYAIEVAGPNDRTLLWEKPAMSLFDANFLARDAWRKWTNQHVPDGMLPLRMVRLSELDGTSVTLPGTTPAKHVSKRKARQPVKGQTCPANRTAKAHDPKVTILPRRTSGERLGVRDCGKCGKPDVPVYQSVDQDGYPLAAWYYGRHTV